jgi:putative oxidoreductase
MDQLNRKTMKQKIFNGVSILFGLWMLNAGLNKFFNYMPMPEDMPESMLKLMEHLMAFGWMMPLVGAVEAIAGLLIVVPRTRTLGALAMFPVMVGILLINIVNVPSGLPVAAPLMVINVWMLWEGGDKLKALWS